MISLNYLGSKLFILNLFLLLVNVFFNLKLYFQKNSIDWRKIDILNFVSLRLNRICQEMNN